MKNKFLLLLLTLVCALCCAFALPACGEKEVTEHTHSFINYVSDNNATCTEDGTKTAKCEGCGKTDTVTDTGSKKEHIFSEEWSLSDTAHFHKCTACETTNNETAHKFTDNKCEVCKFVKGTEGLEYTLNEYDKTYIITGIGTATDTDIIISSHYNGLPVVSIGNEAFKDCTSLTSITITDGVTKIGNGAFGGCTSLTNIIIPDSVIDIAGGAFRECTSLESITIPNGVTKIDGFYNCTSLTNIIIPDSVTEIGYGAFWGCTSLTSIIIPDGVTSISWDAFRGCTSLEIVTMGNGITSIGDRVFRDCTSLTSIAIPDSMTSIGKEAFCNCTSLTVYCEAVEKPSGWSSDWNSSNWNEYCPVVWDCKNNDKDKDGYVYSVIDGIRYKLKDDIATIIGQPLNLSGEIIIPSEVTYKSFVFQITSIGGYAFNQCSSLTSITIPDRESISDLHPTISC